MGFCDKALSCFRGLRPGKVHTSLFQIVSSKDADQTARMRRLTLPLLFTDNNIRVSFDKA